MQMVQLVPYPFPQVELVVRDPATLNVGNDGAVVSISGAPNGVDFIKCLNRSR